jgi:1-acyl-sn-glycerol-3-phosphate acyltransferase
MANGLHKIQSNFRALWRTLRVVAHVARGAWIVALHFPRLDEVRQHAHVQAWAATLLVRAGVRLEVKGQPPVKGPLLAVSNHISWLDIPIMHAARHCRFISKSDVKGWPVIGMLATAAGTLYIERSSRRDALRMVSSMQQAFGRGEILAVFPEGTTGDGRELLPFHSNLLEAAVQCDAPVLPVGLRFVDGKTGETSYAATYVGDETLLGSIWRVLGADDLVAVVHYGEPQRAQGLDRRLWAQELHAEVDRLRQGLAGSRT